MMFYIARLFGKKHTSVDYGRDGYVRLTFYEFNGKYYLWDEELK